MFIRLPAIVFLFLAFSNIGYVETFDLFSWIEEIMCYFGECCGGDWVKRDTYDLQWILSQKVYGQHIALETMTRALENHLRDESPSKALVLSFHGTAGVGKTFVSEHIARQLFLKGTESQYVHKYLSTLHFPHDSLVAHYQYNLRRDIRESVRECPRSLFIIDEMEKMPSGIIDALKPFLDHHSHVNGIDYRKAIYIFLSNTAASDINKYTLKQWELGRKREDLLRAELEDILLNATFHQEGGLWHSDLVARRLISAFVPFLPLERHHVKMCILDHLRGKYRKVTETILDKIADEMSFFPRDKKIFATYGCRPVIDKAALFWDEF